MGQASCYSTDSSSISHWIARNMPFFTVLVHGTGIRIVDSDADRPIAEFYTSRTMWAESEAVAVARACASVRELWARPEYARSNTGSAPAVSAESCKAATFLRWLKAPNRGHTFYSEESRAI
jgi:hypothetical protein